MKTSLVTTILSVLFMTPTVYAADAVLSQLPGHQHDTHTLTSPEFTTSHRSPTSINTPQSHYTRTRKHHNPKKHRHHVHRHLHTHKKHHPHL